MLLILSLVYYLHLDLTGYSDRVKWLAGALLIAAALVILAVGLRKSGRQG